MDKTCRNLTETDAPLNGGLVCHWYREENSQQCSVKCNPGYDFPSRINNFEMCGPTTGFLWSHEEREEPIEPCIGWLRDNCRYMTFNNSVIMKDGKFCYHWMMFSFQRSSSQTLDWRQTLLILFGRVGTSRKLKRTK